MRNKKVLQFTALLLGFSALVFWVWILPAYSQGNEGVDLSIAKYVFPTSVLEPGETIRYTLVISNQSELTATNVIITDVLPVVLTGLEMTSTVPVTQTGNGWVVGTLLPGAHEILTLTAQITSGVTSEFIFTNSASINSPLTDTFPANDQSSVSSEINLPPTVDAGPDLAAYPNTLIRWTGTFTDPGTDDTHAVVVAWGDNTLITGTVDQISRLITATHTYSAQGLYTATVTLSDSDGGTGEDTIQIYVQSNSFNIYIPTLFNSAISPSLVMNRVYPEPETVAPLGSEISITYNLSVYPETITSQSFLIHASQTGFMTGTYQILDNTVIFQPEQALKPGENVDVITTVGIQGFELYPIPATSPTLWQFRATSSGGSGFMLPHSSTPSFGAGDSQDVALGDLDHDGDLDAVVANTSPPWGTVWMNDGLGNFSSHPATPDFGSENTLAVALGDLDHDGDLDAILVGATGETVWLNDGQGNFSAHPTMPDFGNPSGNGIDLGDLDGDGDLDAVVTGSGGEAQTVWLSDGMGGFSAHPVTPAFGEGDSWGVALGDIDSDYDLDAVIANGNGEPETVWLNDGQGNFTPHPTTPSFGAGNSQDVALGDFDIDLDLDVVIANRAGEPETIWLNNGQGDFTPHPTMPGFGLGDSRALALADLDGDLDLDVVVANGGDEPETVWLNDGQGNLSTLAQQTGVGSGDSEGIATGDLDGDGDLDLVLANAEQETVWINLEMRVIETSPSGNGGLISQDGVVQVTFDAPVDVSTVTSATFTVRGKFTGRYPGVFSFSTPTQVLFTPAIPFKPGENIQVTLSRFILSTESVSLAPYTWTFRGAVEGGTGEMTLHSDSPFGINWSYGSALGDLDGDQDLDIVESTFLNPLDQHNRVWLNDGTGAYSLHPTQPSFSMKDDSVSLGDLDGDGDLDAIFTGSAWEGVYSSVWLNDGTGGLSRHPEVPYLGGGVLSYKVDLGDIDGDGDLDALLQGNQMVWLNNGNGVFVNSPSLMDQNIDIWKSTLGDINGDGDLDAILISEYGPQIWSNNGRGFFTLDYTFQSYCNGIELGDLDGDHDLDLIMGCHHRTSSWLNDGQGNFSEVSTFNEGFPTDMTLGDIDGDSDLDVIINRNDESLIFVNDGLGNFDYHPTFPDFGSIGGFWIEFGDVDGDNDLDVVFSTQPFGNKLGFYVWLNE